MPRKRKQADDKLSLRFTLERSTAPHVFDELKQLKTSYQTTIRVVALLTLGIASERSAGLYAAGWRHPSACAPAGTAAIPPSVEPASACADQIFLSKDEVDRAFGEWK